MDQGMGKNQDLWNNQVKPGMVVMSADGDRLGTIKEARETDFWLDREGAPDLRLPYSEIKEITENFVTLNRRSGDLDSAGWDKVADTDIRPRAGDLKL